jgi:hypothetical protein
MQQGNVLIPHFHMIQRQGLSMALFLSRGFSVSDEGATMRSIDGEVKEDLLVLLGYQVYSTFFSLPHRHSHIACLLAGNGKGLSTVRH